MSPTKIDQPRAELMARLAAHKTIGSAPREELEWLAIHGEVRFYTPGEIIVPMTATVVGEDEDDSADSRRAASIP